MTLGAVVVAHHRPRSLDRCLASLAEVSEVVVANVTADPEVRCVVHDHERTELPISSNVGYAAAVNMAVGRLPLSVDEVLFLNDDVCLGDPPAAIGQADVRVLRQRTPEGRELPVLHRLPTPLGFFIGWILGRQPRATPGRLPRGVAGNGAAVVAKRVILERHPLPEQYFLYWEETAWFWMLTEAGVSVALDAAYAERPDGREEHSPLKDRLLGENLVRLAGERYGPAGTWLYRALGVIWLFRLAVTDARRIDRAARWAARRRTLAGLLRTGGSRARG